MKKFLISTGVFLLVAIIVLAATYFSLLYMIRNKAEFKIRESTSYIVLGPSHSACSFDDNYIGNLENFSMSGESYCYAYIKLKKLLEANQGIKTAVVELSNQFIYDSEEWLWSGKYLHYHYVTFAPFFTYDDNRILFKGHLKELLGSYPFIVKFTAKNILKKDYEYAYKTGGHEIQNRVIVKGNQYKDINPGPLNVNLAFLDKMVECCRESNVQLVFLRSPLHHDFVYWQTETEFQQIRKERYGDVPFLDFGNFIIDDEFFADYQHLNQNGAELFSKTIDRIIKEDLLNENYRFDTINQKNITQFFERMDMVN